MKKFNEFSKKNVSILRLSLLHKNEVAITFLKKNFSTEYHLDAEMINGVKDICVRVHC